MATSTTQRENEMAKYTITTENDGTYIVRENGKALHRWPTFELAERRVYSLIRWDQLA